MYTIERLALDLYHWMYTLYVGILPCRNGTMLFTSTRKTKSHKNLLNIIEYYYGIRKTGFLFLELVLRPVLYRFEQHITVSI